MLSTLLTEKDNDYCLKHNRVDIWQFSLKSPPLLSHSILTATEQARAERFYFERHKRRFTVARTIMRLILARYLGVNAEKIDFSYNKYGKPYIENSTVEFNLSHSNETALLAISSINSIGIDLEFFSARPYEGIAKQLFSTEELSNFLALSDFLKPQAFFRVWAQKEAFIKACGMGLSYPTKDFTVPVLEFTSAPIFDRLGQKEWLMKTFMPEPLCQAALCYHQMVNEIYLINFSQDHEDNLI